MLEVLDPLCTGKTLFVFDFDGTLAPIVMCRADAAMPRTTRKLFTYLAASATTVVISGRSVSDLRMRLKVEPDYLVGNHGLEGPSGNAAMLHRAQRLSRVWQQQLENYFHEAPNVGIELEDKQYSLAIHYRLAPDARRARRAITHALAKLQPLPQLIAGKRVINVLPIGAPDKGAALLQLIHRTHTKKALYIGDDDTDEAVFALDDPRIVTVRIGRKLTSCAQYYLREQTEIDVVLRYLTHCLGVTGST